MHETHIHHLRLLLVISQLACMFLFPLWMYTDVWQIITQLHKVKGVDYVQLACLVIFSCSSKIIVIPLSLSLPPSLSLPLSPSLSLPPSLSFFLTLVLPGATLGLVVASSTNSWSTGIWAELCSVQYHLYRVSSQLLCSQCHQANRRD